MSGDNIPSKLIADLEATAMQLDGAGGWPRAGLTARAAITEIQRLIRQRDTATAQLGKLLDGSTAVLAERDRLISERDAAIHSAVVEGERGDRLTRELDEMRGSRDRWKRRADDLFFGTNDEAESSPERAGVHKNGDPL